MDRYNKKYIDEACSKLNNKNIKIAKDNLIKEYDKIHKENQGNYDGHNLISMSKPPINKEESIQYGNALAISYNYPVGLSGCFAVGISGECGLDCYVYKDGECEYHSEMIDRFETEDDVIEYKELYGDIIK